MKSLISTPPEPPNPTAHDFEGFRFGFRHDRDCHVSSKVDEVSSKVELTQGSAVTDEPRAAASG